MSPDRLQIQLVVMLLGVAAAARAVPPDKVIPMKTGDVLYVPAGKGHWQALSSAPGVVKVSMAPASEVFLEALSRGEALVLVENRVVGRLSIWKVRVGYGEAAGEQKLPDLSTGHCTCSRPEPAEPPVCLVSNTECLDCLRQKLEDSDAVATDFQFRYDIPGMQALLLQLQRHIESEGFSGIELAFAGANLRLEGKVRDEGERARLLFTLYRRMLGRMVLEDRLVVEKAAE